MKTLLILLLSTLSAYSQTHREISEDGIHVKLKQTKTLFGTVNDMTLIDIFDGDRLLFTTKTSDSAEEARREIEAFINLQKLLASSYKKKLSIDLKAAAKPQSAIDEVKALFSFNEPEEFKEIPSDCIDKLHENNLGNLDKKLSHNLIQNEVLAVDQRDIKIKYVQQKALGFKNGVDVDIYIKDKLVHSLHYGLDSQDEVYRELTPIITQMRTSKQPVILQFGKSQRNGTLLTQTDRFKEIFSQDFKK